MKDMRKPQRFFLSLTILVLTLGLSVMPLPAQARDAVRSVNPTQLDPLHGYAATSKYGFMSPLINETAKEAGARHDLVPEEDRYPVAMVGPFHRVSSRLLPDLLHSISGQHYSAQFAGGNPSEVNEPRAQAGTDRLAGGIDSGNYFIPVGPARQSSGLGGAGTPGTDRAVLVALYQATDGENWARNTNWLSGQPIGDWYGIVTGDDGRVSEVGLPDNLLRGELPSELGDLTNLESLSLGSNQLSGPIPTELGDLANLESLSLGSNQLSGQIPPGLGDLANLESLSLGSNQLSGSIPTELGDLINLESLSLGSNQLSGLIPTELGDLATLESLSLGSNQLSGPIPTELGDLATLESLSLGSNQLSGPIPTELGDLTPLMHLDLSDNQLSGGIARGLLSLTRLTHLDLRSNGLAGDIPTAIGNLVGLTELYLSGNELSGDLPSELAGLAKLAHLDLSGNRFTGEIPFELEGLTSLELLSIRANQLSGPIPSELGNLANLIHLDLSDNQLVGPIPSELSSLSRLIGLYLSGNRLTGCIPVELWVVATSDLDQLGLPYCGGLTVVMSVPPGGVQVRIDSPIAVTATFSEPVTGFTVGDVSVVNGSAVSFPGSDGDTVYTFVVVPNAIGAVTVDISSSVAEDSGGIGNRAAPRLWLGIPYDDDGDGAINKGEVIEAINDYLFSSDPISKGDVIKLINLYLFGS